MIYSICLSGHPEDLRVAELIINCDHYGDCICDEILAVERKVRQVNLIYDVGRVFSRVFEW